MESESGFTRSVTDALGSSDIQTDQMEGEKCVTRSIIDELHSWDIVKSKEKVVLFGVSLMNFILWISKEIKRKVKVVLLEVSWMNFIVGLSK